MLFREQWAGPAGSALQALPSTEQPCTQLPRPQPPQLHGVWNVFTVSATAIEEEAIPARPTLDSPGVAHAAATAGTNGAAANGNGATGGWHEGEEDEEEAETRVSWVYSSVEERQLWDTRGDGAAGLEGGAFWLPGGACTVRACLMPLGS